jgi:hypothetical protein
MEIVIYSVINTIVTVGLVLVAAILFLKFYLKEKGKIIRKPQENIAVPEEHKIILPLRLQAYERLVLFLERINPNNLIMRMNRPEMSASQFQSLLVKTVREEFEYNLSQQLYVSSTSWELIRNAKEETINLINQASSKVDENASSSALVREIFDQFLGKEKSSVEKALEEIKQEIRGSF